MQTITVLVVYGVEELAIPVDAEKRRGIAGTRSVRPTPKPRLIIRIKVNHIIKGVHPEIIQRLLIRSRISSHLVQGFVIDDRLSRLQYRETSKRIRVLSSMP